MNVGSETKLSPAQEIQRIRETMVAQNLSPSELRLLDIYRCFPTYEDALLRAKEGIARFQMGVLLVTLRPDFHLIVPHTDVLRAHVELQGLGFEAPKIIALSAPDRPISPRFIKKDPMRPRKGDKPRETSS